MARSATDTASDKWPTGLESAVVTRRELFGRLAKAAALGSIATASFGAATLSGCSDSDEGERVVPLEVDENAVVTLDGFSEVKTPKSYYRTSEVAKLDGGIKLSNSGGSVAAALCTGATAAPLSTIALLDLESGRLNMVLDAAVGQHDGYELYDVACSDRTIVWVESNYLTSDWRVFVAPVNASKLTIGAAAKVDEGDAFYDEPEIACIGDSAFWIVQPAEDGDRTEEDSVLKSSSASGSGGVLHTSHGRFNGGLWTSGNVLTAMPRADASGMYYQLAAFEGGSLIASQVLPRSFKPLDAVYMGGKFAFSIPASYDYGGGIANVGTYYPLGDTEWLRLTRMPTTPPGLCNGWLFCKSASRTVFVDLQRRRYFTVNPPSGSADYGDYSVSTGEVGAVYNYSTVKESEGAGSTKHVVVRKIEPADVS